MVLAQDTSDNPVSEIYLAIFITCSHFFFDVSSSSRL